MVLFSSLIQNILRHLTNSKVQNYTIIAKSKVFKSKWNDWPVTLMKIGYKLLSNLTDAEIAGMSDPEKAAELQKAVSTGQSPSQGCNSDNAYWSGSSLPTQVSTLVVTFRYIG